MADNTVLNPGSGGDTIRTDDIAGVKYQVVKLALGADGADDGWVSQTSPAPVQTAANSSALGRASVSDTSSTAVAARTARTSVLLVNRGSNDVALNLGAAAVYASHFILKAGESVTLPTKQAIHAICDTGLTSELHYVEFYNA